MMLYIILVVIIFVISLVFTMYNLLTAEYPRTVRTSRSCDIWTAIITFLLTFWGIFELMHHLNNQIHLLD
jgi:hypothetical protein